MSLITKLTSVIVEEAKPPTAFFVQNPAFGVVGSVIKLDGRLSTDPDNKPLSYSWRFVSVPIGSQVQIEGFRTIDLDSNTSTPLEISFSPDLVGEYVVGLTVSNGVFESEEISKAISIRAILVPHGRSIVPDGKFIWSYIRDVWSQVDGKEFFETLWSALIQISGSELLKLYQVDFNKSIRDIQDNFQRRWLQYDPKLQLVQDDLSFYIGNHCAGRDASTVNLGLEGLGVILNTNELVVILGARLQNVAGETLTITYSQDTDNIGDFELSGLNATRTGYRLLSSDLDPTSDTIVLNQEWTFSLGSTTWSGSGISSILNGDVIHYPKGPNAGFYRIIEKNLSTVVVDHAPPSFSDVTTSITLKSNVYRPVGFRVTQPSLLTTDTFSVPYTPGANDVSVVAKGRMITVGGYSYKIVRSVIDRNQIIPSVIITIDSDNLPADQRSLNWRTPYTIISESQDFTELGVASGDLLVFDITLEGSELSSEIIGQVVGVKDNTIGFVLTDEAIEPGVIPPIPNSTYLKLASDLGIDGVTETASGELVFTGMAQQLRTEVNSGNFKRKYWNTELTPSSDIQINSVFRVKPKYIVRNRSIPVDDSLRSIPALQDWIVQPTIIERDGKIFQVSKDKEFELRTRPRILLENFDYTIDDETAFYGRLTFETGTDEIEADGADFIDKNIKLGDLFIIESPITLYGIYEIRAILSNNKIRVSRPVPAYVFGPFVTATVTIKRREIGRFIRFIPGLFTAKNPAPVRLWAEASLFDNNQTIENNFGILVGLKKETLDSVSKDINYRQAVSGLMFAFTRGSALEKVRLGAQILLGLPFAEHRGIIRSIEEDYRLDVNGTPILGRLLIEDVDSTGMALGTLRIYTYPIDQASNLAGLEINPNTNSEYAIGDIVELFAPLSKGVEIVDYKTDPSSFDLSSITQLQKFHSVRLRANDNIFSLNELDLVSEFLRKITPSYIAFAFIINSEFVDIVNVEDRVIQRIQNNNLLVDNASLNIPPTLMFDSTNADGVNQILWDDGVMSVRRVGRDLVTIDGSVNVTSASGGFIDPKSNESFEPPLVLPSDLIIIAQGINKGIYTIGSVVSDTELTLTDGTPALGFEDSSDQYFYIVRKIVSPIVSGTADVSTSSSEVQLNGTPALRTMGVAPGDWFIIHDGTTGYRHLIREVKESTPGSNVWDIVDITPNPKFTSATAIYSITRPALRTSDTYSVFADGSNNLDASNNPQIQGLLSIGDELVLGNERVTVLDPATMYVTPVPSTTGDIEEISIAFKNRSSSTVGWDHISYNDPIDGAEISVLEDQALATCTSSSNEVSLEVERTTSPTSGPDAFDPQAAGIMPGDLLNITSGANSLVDVGHGPGVYVIVEITPTSVILSVDLTATESTSWKIIRRR